MAYQEKGADIMSMIGKLSLESTRALSQENIFHQSKTSADGAETIFQKLHQAASGEKDESTVIGKAAEVQISEAGRKLLEDDLDPLKKMCQTDFMAEEKHDRCPGRTDGNADHLRHAKCRRHQRGTGTGKEA